MFDYQFFYNIINFSYCTLLHPLTYTYYEDFLAFLDEIFKSNQLLRMYNDCFYDFSK